jgi:hypothetical protein
MTTTQGCLDEQQSRLRWLGYGAKNRIQARVVSAEISGNFPRNFSGNFRKNNGTFPE